MIRNRSRKFSARRQNGTSHEYHIHIIVANHSGKRKRAGTSDQQAFINGYMRCFFEAMRVSLEDVSGIMRVYEGGLEDE